MEVIELKNPRALLVPEVAAVMRRGIESVHFAAPGGFDTVAKDLFDMTTNENSFILLGAEKGRFKSLVLGFYPTTALFPYPSIILFYNEGTPALRKATTQKLLDILVSRGYTAAWAVNATGRSNEVWTRLFKHSGVDIVPLGSVMQMSVK